MTEERRSLALAAAGVEVRAASDGGPERFAGRAAVYGIRAPIGNPKTWGFFEEFDGGSATESLAADDQRMLVDHDSYYLVSRVSAGDLILTESPAGVDVDSGLDEELSYVRDLKVNVRKRRITGMSIGFYVLDDQWSQIEVEEQQPDGKVRVYTADLRTVRKIQLIEVSAVTWPAFVDTEAALRHAVMPALLARGDVEAIQRRAVHRAEIGDLLRLLDERKAGREPDPEPAAAVRHEPSPDELMAAYANRYPRLRG